MPSDTHDASYYFKCMIGGMLACGLTHTAIVPLDVAKCKLQVIQNFSTGSLDGIKKVFRNGEVTLGWLPTLIGYSCQGLGKFGFYEIFKDVYAKIVGEQSAKKYRTLGWSIASGSAEILADCFLCPWQAIKLKIQLSTPESPYPRKMFDAMRKFNAEQGIPKYYMGIVPLWLRQVPYTIVKFVAFERIVLYFYSTYFPQGKANVPKPTQLFITFLSGYLAGIFCAIVSHPADTILSKLIKSSKKVTDQMTGNKEMEKSIGVKVKEIYKQIGFMGLWKGLPTRIVMIGTLTGLQWWIYDSFKTSIGLQTTGGDAEKNKKH